MKDIQILGVLGSGQMGAGIAQVAAAEGIQVLLADIDLATAQRSVDGIARRLEKQVEKGRIEISAKDQALANIQAVENLQQLADADMVVEAATENPELKIKLFQQLDAVCRPATILASNTSSISITRIAAATSRPESVIGMHFFNPVPVMKLVEVIPGIATDPEVFQATERLAIKLNKTAVTSRDKAGFIVNRILFVMINEACFALEEGVASAEDIDTAMQLGANHPMGPLALADLVGLDTSLAILEVMHRELGESKYRPSPLLKQYVDAGWLGKKSGKGFYSY